MTTKFYIGAEQWSGLSKLIEECGETLQISGKLLGVDGDVTEPHWDGSALKIELEDEIADLTAAIQFFTKHGGLDADRMAERVRYKLTRFERWHELNLEKGSVVK